MSEFTRTVGFAIALAAMAPFAAASVAHLPLAFEHMPRTGAFVLRGSERQLALVPGGMVVQSTRPGSPSRLEVRFGASRTTPAGENRQATQVHYYIGDDPKQWFATSQYKTVRYRDVYPGVDLVFYPTARDVEYDWVLKPGADPSKIRFRVSGSDCLALHPNGDLTVSSRDLRFVQRRPIAYQVTAEGRRPVHAEYRKLGGNEVGIALGAYDKSKELVIDPVLQWLSYLGGTESETGPIIKAAPDGGAYLAFTTNSSYLSFPAATPDFQLNKSRNWVGAVAKLSPDGNLIERLSYFGGAGTTTIKAMALGSDGSLYVGGSTSASDFPLKGAFRSKLQGIDGFALKLTDRFEMVYSTLIGGSSLDEVRAMAVDPMGRLYLTGATSSSDFTRVKALETTPTSGFMTRLDPNGYPEYSSYLWQGGGNQNVYGTAIAADSTGAAYVLVNSDFNSAYVAGISSDGGKYAYKHVLAQPGTRIDTIYLNSIWLHPDGSLYVAGFYSILDPAYLAGGYVGRIAADGGKRTDLFSINNPDTCRSRQCGSFNALAVDADGSVVVSGQVMASWPTVNGFASFGPKVADNVPSVFIGRWNSGLGVTWSTILQGTGYDRAGSMDLGPNGTIYAAGDTRSDDFPTIQSAAGIEFAGGDWDLWFTKIVESGDACQYSLRRDRSSVSGNGGTGSFLVVPNRSECTWEAIPEQDWISVTDGRTGTGIGTVKFLVDSNFSSARAGRILVNGVPHTVYQSDSECVYALSATRGLAPLAGGDVQVTVRAASGCPWTAITAESWIKIVDGPPKKGGYGVLTLTIAANPGAPRTGQLTIADQSYQVVQGGVSDPNAPFITVGGIVNAASGATGVSAFEVVRILGDKLGPADTVSAGNPTAQYPVSLGGVQVYFNGIAAPLASVSSREIVAVVPGAVAKGTTAEAQVVFNGSASAKVSVPVSAAIPGIFATILNHDGTVNSVTAPVPAGTSIAVYATGLGPTDLTLADGAVVTSDTVPHASLPVQLLIGGKNAPIEFVGGVPGMSYGMFQINAKTPADVASGAQPVVLMVGDARSQAGVTVAIQ